MQFDTLCVMATCNEKSIINDQIEAIRWSCEKSVHIVIVDDLRRNFKFKNCTVIESKGKIHKASAVGFKINEGIKWGLNNIDFKIIMALDDDALPIRKGIDSWAISELEKDKEIGLLGTKDDKKAIKNYSDPKRVSNAILHMKEWFKIPPNWRPPQENIFYAVNFQPRSIAEKLQKYKFYETERETWSNIFPCEVFQAWATDLMGFKQFFWGQYPNDLIPPLYSMHHGTVRPADPRNLSEDFKIHHSIRQVEGVKEWEIRKYYKKIRNQKIFV